MIAKQSRTGNYSFASSMSLLADPPGPSRLPRPVSVAAHPPRRHNRSSHGPPDDQPALVDVYAHPAAVAYAAAHPRRQIPKFGPYLLLQTLGEGEFGKVKLGLHTSWGEEVAVKLIRRGNVDSTLRMSKIEREIEVLRVSPLRLATPPLTPPLPDPQAPQHRPPLRRHRD
jgi:serine/threonine protein kinase